LKIPSIHDGSFAQSHRVAEWFVERKTRGFRISARPTAPLALPAAQLFGFLLKEVVDFEVRAVSRTPIGFSAHL
jgi:hypothetical protein